MALTITNAGSANSTTSGATLAVTNVTAAVGDWLVVAIAADNAGTSGAASISSVTDAASNTYTSRAVNNRTAGSVANDGTTLGLFTTTITSALSAATVTVNFSPNTTSKAAAVWRVQPGSGETVLYRSVGSGSTGSGTGPTITATSVTNGDTIFGAVAAEQNAAITADSDTSNGTWSTATSATANSGTTGTSQALQTQYKTVTATANQTYNVTTSSTDYAINWLTLYPVTNSTGSGGITGGAAALGGTATESFDGTGAATFAAASFSGSNLDYAPLSSYIEVELAGRGNGWTDITGDVVGGIRISYGIRGGGPTDRVASSGSLTFSLDNSFGNQAQTLGYWSPLTTITESITSTPPPPFGGSGPIRPPVTITSTLRNGWTVGIRVRARFYDLNTGTTYTKFIGWIQQITPAPGIYGQRQVQVIATDWIDVAARSPIAGLTTQTSKRSDQIISTLIGNVDQQPEATSIATGLDTYAYALDTVRDDRTNPVLQELSRVTQSESGYFYVKGDGTAVFEARFGRQATDPNLTLDNDMVSIDQTTDRSQVITKVQAIVHPRTVDAAAVVLYSLQGTISIDPGVSITIVAGYNDPANRAERVGGISMVAPVATTDYLANSAADGTGSNLTTSLGVTATYSSNAATYTLVNNGTVALYVTKLQARGIGLYDYQQVVAQAEDTALAAQYGEMLTAIDMPYQSSVTTGAQTCTFLLAIYKPRTVGLWYLGVSGSSNLDSSTILDYSLPNTVSSVTVNARTPQLQSACLYLEPGSAISLKERISGLTTIATSGRGTTITQTAQLFSVQAVDLTIAPPGIPTATYTLAPADGLTYWRLDNSRYSLLGRTTTVAY